MSVNDNLQSSCSWTIDGTGRTGGAYQFTPMFFAPGDLRAFVLYQGAYDQGDLQELDYGTDWEVEVKSSYAEGAKIYLSQEKAAQYDGWTLTVMRRLPLSQELELRDLSRLPMRQLEHSLDLAALRDQQIQEQLDRCAMIPPGKEDYSQFDFFRDFLNLAENGADWVASAKQDAHDAQLARSYAYTYRNEAQTYRNDAQTYRNDAQAAKTAAETARATAETARDASEEYRDAAQAAAEAASQPLRFTATEDGATVALDKVGSPYAVSLLYSTDGVSWTAYEWDGQDGAAITLAHVGDYVIFKGDNAHFSKGTVLSSTSITDYYQFSVSAGSVNASGNVMSLLDSTCRLKKIPDGYCFACLFLGCVLLEKAPDLPATGLANDCYWRMFANSGIRTTPELPAMQLEVGCYSSMFEGCVALASASPLPAMELVNSCYNSMFKECQSLVVAPELPAMKLANSCYAYMFDHCVALEFAPRLPSPELVAQCYIAMFQRCTSLRHVEADFRAFGTSNETLYWLFGTAASGRFIGWSGLYVGTRGVSTVPTGWSVEYCVVRKEDLGTPLPDDPSPQPGKRVLARDLGGNLSWAPLISMNYSASDQLGDIIDMKASVHTDIETSTASSLSVDPGCAYAWTPSANATLSLGTGFSSGKEAYVSLTVSPGAHSVTLSSDFDSAHSDTLSASKKNICVIRWDGSKATLYKCAEV